MPPYSMPVSRTASSIAAKEILRTSSRLRMTRLTSALSVARTRHAAMTDVVGAPAGHYNAVRRDGQRHIVRSTELGCVRVAGIDASDEALQAKLGHRILDRSRQELGMFTSRLPIQRANDVHQGRIIVRLTVADSEDARLSDYVRLRETSLRRHLESERGLFIAEGEKVIRRAIEAGYQPRSFLLAERWLEGLSDVVQRWPAVPVFVVTEDLAEQITGFHVHRGALASLHREQRHTVEDLVAMRRLVVLEDIVDHANVGAILRNAAGLGWDGALLVAAGGRSAVPPIDQGEHGCGFLIALGATAGLARSTRDAGCGRLSHGGARLGAGCHRAR